MGARASPRKCWGQNFGHNEILTNSKSNQVDIFPGFLYEINEYSVDSSTWISNSPEVLNFDPFISQTPPRSSVTYAAIGSPVHCWCDKQLICLFLAAEEGPCPRFGGCPVATSSGVVREGQPPEASTCGEGEPPLFGREFWGLGLHLHLITRRLLDNQSQAAQARSLSCRTRAGLCK